MAICAMRPAAPERTAGFIALAAGFVTISMRPVMVPFESVNTARLTPRSDPFIRLYLPSFSADSFVSLTQRPDVAATSAPAWARPAADRSAGDRKGVV